MASKIAVLHLGEEHKLAYKEANTILRSVNNLLVGQTVLHIAMPAVFVGSIFSFMGAH